MGVDVGYPRGAAELLEADLDAVGFEATCAACGQPQVRQIRAAAGGPAPEVAADGSAGLRPDPHAAVLGALAVEADGLAVQVDVVEHEVADLGQAPAGVVDQPDDRLVPQVHERPARARRQQGAGLLGGDDRNQLLGRLGLADACHRRATDRLLVDGEPLEELLQALVPVQRGGCRAGVDPPRLKGLDVRAGDAARVVRGVILGALGGQVAAELGDREQVVGAGGLRVVVGAQGAIPVAQVAGPGGGQATCLILRMSIVGIIRNSPSQGVQQRRARPDIDVKL